MADSCPRDSGGFCRVALLGHPRCNWPEDGGCKIPDDGKESALWEAVNREAAKARAALSKGPTL